MTVPPWAMAADGMMHMANASNAARFVMEQVQLVAAARLLSAACTITDAAITTYAADGCAHIHKGEF